MDTLTLILLVVYTTFASNWLRMVSKVRYWWGSLTAFGKYSCLVKRSFRSQSWGLIPSNPGWENCYNKIVMYIYTYVITTNDTETLLGEIMWLDGSLCLIFYTSLYCRYLFFFTGSKLSVFINYIIWNSTMLVKLNDQLHWIHPLDSCSQLYKEGNPFANCEQTLCKRWIQYLTESHDAITQFCVWVEISLNY